MNYLILTQYLPFFWGALFGMGVSGILYGILSRPLMRRLERRVQDREDQFVSLASHYLRTPITVLQIALSRLQEKDTQLGGPERTKLYDALEGGTQRLLLLSEQLTAVGLADQSALYPKPTVTVLADVATDAIAFIDPFSRAKSIHCRLRDLSRDAPQVRCDPRLIRQALIALLDNAVKFSPDNKEILVTVGHQGSAYYVSIQDQGIGMPMEITRHLTEKFYRGTPLYNFDYEGIGLGLHIAQAVAVAHGGTLAFQSTTRQGTLASLQIVGL